MSLAAFLGKVDGYQATPELSRVSGVFRDGFRTFPIIFEYSGTPNIVRLDQIGLDITTDSLYAMVLEILEIPRNPTIKKKHAYITFPMSIRALSHEKKVPVRFFFYDGRTDRERNCLQKEKVKTAEF